ncbi:flavocytochrome c [Paenibacillus sp. ACRRX]|uniref:flavocytochrome c n=1 Tax=Paenibacillus sp. ACRRX TaxID=2918206 RepID=UPI001EF7518A|nr:flavocytochrome c [Paenibacillus sp. ACRRX]MCG7408968.1 flavocytochrome c [Paenibacillus sp. ACRRX]
MKRKCQPALMILLAFLLLISGCGGASSKQPGPEAGANQQAEENKEKEKEDAVSSPSLATYTPLDQLKESYDVVIVGAGGAGMTAALEVKAAGLSPVILEKMQVAGGNTSKASSGMNASETKFQKEQNITDTNDLFYDETLKGGHLTNNKDMLRYFVDHSAAAIDWLDSNGIRLNNITITGGMSKKRTHRPEDGSAVGKYLVSGLIKKVQEQGIPLFVNANVQEVTSKDGKATGVKVDFSQANKNKTIAAKSVVITAGGFGANMELIKKVRPDLEGYVTTNQEGSTGDGIKMVEHMGGTTVDMDQIQVHPTVQQENSYLIGEVVRGEGAILVSNEGKRFVNEMGARDSVTAAINKLPEKNAYLIFDSGVKSRAKAIDYYEKMGFVKQADTIKGLAEIIRVPAAPLQKTLEGWNTAVKSKKDDTFNRKTGMEHELSGTPYYAIKIGPGIHYTMGGVKINTNTEVLDKDGKPIPALFAAGEVTGGLHGENRIGGNSIAEIIIFGRQAGMKSAQYVKSAK